MTKPVKLLNIEDDPADFLLLQRHLQRHGMRAECTRIATRAELIAAIEREAWDVVISDYSLPGQEFRDLLALLLARRPATPVILLSGSIGEEEAVELLKAGLWDFVLKDKLTRLIPSIERSLREAVERAALRHAEGEALRLSESLRQSSQAMLLADAALCITYLNPAFAQLFGYCESELAGAPVGRLCPADAASHELQAQLLAELHASGRWAGELALMAGDGALIPVFGSLSAVRDERGEPGERHELLGFVGNFVDLRPLRKNERALRASEEKYRRLVEGLQDEYFFYQYDHAGVFTYVSASVSNVLGFTPDEYRIHYRESLTDAPINAGVLKCAELSLQGEQQPLFEVEVWHKDGSRRRLEVMEHPVKEAGGGVAAVDGFAHDVTRRLAIAQELRLRGAALEAAANAILITDADGVIEWANASFVALTGYPLSEAIGRNPRELFRSGVQPANFYTHLWETIKGGQVWHGELINRRRDGSRYFEDMTIAPVPDESGAIRHFVAIKLDISARKAIESELTAHREHLEELVSERTAELDAARREAERLARGKGDFLANMSHEIRTPLNAVLGFAQVGYKECVGRKTQRHFAQVLDSGELLLGIINDVLDFSKFEAGKLAVERQPVDLRLAIERAAALVAGRAHDKDLQWTVDCAPDLPAGCLGDGLRLTQILVNLLSNAVKFTACGGIALSARRAGESLIFAVADSGIGMDAEQQARVFTAFEQGDTTTTRRFGGTGLGLAISRRLAELMGGEISVDSAPGQGSVFTLRLPYVAAEPPLRVAAPGPATGPRLAGLSILVAEDNEVNQLVLAELLAAEQARLEFVANGRLAVERMNAAPHAFDLILMDIQMPEVDGYEAARRILARFPAIPIIALTAHALADERDRIIAAGMRAQVTKPVQLEELVTTILSHARLAEVADGQPLQSSPAAADAGFVAASCPDLAVAAPLVDWTALEANYRRLPGFVIKLLKLALESNAQTAAELRAAAEAPDLARIAFLAHRTKGVAGNLFAGPLGELAIAAERAARAEAADAPEQACRLAAGVDRLLAEMTDRLATGKHL